MIQHSTVRFFYAAYYLEECAFAASAFADYTKYLALMEVKIHMLKRPDLTITAYIFLIQIHGLYIPYSDLFLTVLSFLQSRNITYQFLRIFIFRRIKYLIRTSIFNQPAVFHDPYIISHLTGNTEMMRYQ